MRCVVVTWFLPGQIGFLDFARRIRALAARCDTTIIARAPLDAGEFDLHNAQVCVIPASVRNSAGWAVYLWKSAVLIDRINPDTVVILHSAIAALRHLIGRRRTALYWNEHPLHCFNTLQSKLSLRAWWKAYQRHLAYTAARTAHIVMPIGEAHRADLLAHGCSPERIRLIYMGVDTEFIKSAPARSRAVEQPLGVGAPPRRPLRLIYAGSITRERGLQVMIEGIALANRHGRKAHLTIVGASPQGLAEAERLIHEHDVSDVVRVMSRVSGTAIPALLWDSDLGICIWAKRLYWEYNPPTKLFEYLVAGLPVLASNIRTHTLYLEPWKTGVIFEYAGCSLAEAIEAVWERQGELEPMKRSAAEAGQRFLWPALEREFLHAVGVDTVVNTEQVIKAAPGLAE
jgi:glycosyltransferase involved in cell wall biosynthesis